MALTVQTNNAAMTALKHLNTNSANMNKSLERLSSGFRVNSAADDASGFAVASKLDAQTQRLKAASQNATQATAMVKMADAGVNEIQNMVSRIQVLATQAASANNAGELGKLDAERIKLEAQIDKIAASTNYNGVNLLNGKDANGAGAVTAVAATTTTVATNTSGINTGAATSTGVYETASFQISTTAGTAASVGATTTETVAANLTGVTSIVVGAGAQSTAVNGDYFVQSSATTAASITVFKGTDASGVNMGTFTSAAASFTLANQAVITLGGANTAAGASAAFNIGGSSAAAAGTVTGVTSTADLTDSKGNVIAAAGTNILASASQTRDVAGGALALSLTGGGSITVTDGAAAAQLAGVAVVNTTGGTTGVEPAYTAAIAFQVGADNNTNNQVSVDLRNSYTTSSLGLAGANGTSLTTQAGAQAYIDTVKSAMDTLITQRADLGATQNQLGFVQSNLATSIEQSTAAVSSIRDADMAAEMATFTKNQILTQAGTSMLAQANQAAQNVLSLFR